VPVRAAILPPVPVPYREPLFARLAQRGQVAPRVIYLAGSQPGWDQSPDWFPDRHESESELLDSRQRVRSGRSPLTLPRGLGAALKRADPQCVVSWEYGPATWRALAWCRRQRRPLVVFSELTPWSDGELSSTQLRIHHALAPRMAGFVAASSQGVRRLDDMGVDPHRVEVSLQSADLEAFAAVAGGGSTAPSETVRVLSVGRLVPDKNLGLLIDAFTRAGFAPGEAELMICGSGPLEDRLRAQAEAVGAPVRFLGYTAPAELPPLYGYVDVLALVSGYEPFGVTMREGAAAGLPLICSRRAGAAGDVAVEGENALLVDPDDVDDVVAALRRLVREPTLRELFAAGSRSVTARHPAEADVEAWERAILRATGGSSAE
jgi:glycosyltransferase involved in cell wall biosynthesis